MPEKFPDDWKKKTQAAIRKRNPSEKAKNWMIQHLNELAYTENGSKVARTFWKTAALHGQNGAAVFADALHECWIVLHPKPPKYPLNKPLDIKNARKSATFLADFLDRWNTTSSQDRPVRKLNIAELKAFAKEMDIYEHAAKTIARYKGHIFPLSQGVGKRPRDPKEWALVDLLDKFFRARFGKQPLHDVTAAFLQAICGQTHSYSAEDVRRIMRAIRKGKYAIFR